MPPNRSRRFVVALLGALTLLTLTALLLVAKAAEAQWRTALALWTSRGPEVLVGGRFSARSLPEEHTTSLLHLRRTRMQLWDLQPEPKGWSYYNRIPELCLVQVRTGFSTRIEAQVCNADLADEEVVLGIERILSEVGVQVTVHEHQRPWDSNGPMPLGGCGRACDEWQ